MENKKLEIDIYVLVKLMTLLPEPSTFVKDKYVVAVSDTDSFSEITFLKINNTWKLLMDSTVEKTDKLQGLEFNAVWVED